MDERERARLRAAIDAAEGRGPGAHLSDASLRALFAATRNIAIVGASPRPDRPSHGVLLALAAAGWNILPVNPHPVALASGIAGHPCYPSLTAAAARLPDGERIDLVDVFRRPEDCAAVAREAVSISARWLWLQLGIVDEASAQVAAEASMPFVQDRCTAIEVARLGIRSMFEGDRRG